MTRKDLVDEWLLLATDDLEVAEHLLTVMRGAPLEIICFHCQQAGEKGLKALLQHLGRDVPRTHDLVELRRLLAWISTGNHSPKHFSDFGLHIIDQSFE